MDIFYFVITSTIILSIGTKIGFIIQRVYFDIKGIVLAAFLAIITAIVLLGYPILSILIASIMFIYLLCKIGQIEAMPDAILATLIGILLLIIILINNFNVINLFY